MKGSNPICTGIRRKQEARSNTSIGRFTSFQCNRGCKEGATQATPVSAKHSKLIERETGLLMVKKRQCPFRKKSAQARKFLRKRNWAFYKAACSDVRSMRIEVLVEFDAAVLKNRKTQKDCESEGTRKRNRRHPRSRFGGE
jgi:hypothetical protein